MNYGKASISSVAVSWERPNLSANGTLGGNAFAVYPSGTYNPSYYECYKAFTGTVSSSYDCWICNASSGYVIMYNPVPLKISSFNIYNHIGSNATYCVKSGSVQASNDNSTWTTILSSYTNDKFGSTDNWIINVNSPSYYKYYKLNILSNGASQCYINEIYINATYLTSSANTITFPNSYSTTNYSYSLAYLNGIFGDSYVTSKSKSGMNLQNNSNATNVYYITAGY